MPTKITELESTNTCLDGDLDIKNINITLDGVSATSASYIGGDGAWHELADIPNGIGHENIILSAIDVVSTNISDYNWAIGDDPKFGEVCIDNDKCVYNYHIDSNGNLTTGKITPVKTEVQGDAQGQIYTVMEPANSIEKITSFVELASNDIAFDDGNTTYCIDNTYAPLPSGVNVITDPSGTVAQLCIDGSLFDINIPSSFTFEHSIKSDFGDIESAVNTVNYIPQPVGDLRVSKSFNTTIANIGDIVSWNISVCNLSSSPLAGDVTDITVTDILPNEIDPSSVSALSLDGFSVAGLGTTNVVATLSSALIPGECRDLVFSASVSSLPQNPGTINNIVVAVGDDGTGPQTTTSADIDNLNAYEKIGARCIAGTGDKPGVLERVDVLSATGSDIPLSPPVGAVSARAFVYAAGGGGGYYNRSNAAAQYANGGVGGYATGCFNAQPVTVVVGEGGHSGCEAPVNAYGGGGRSGITVDGTDGGGGGGYSGVFLGATPSQGGALIIAGGGGGGGSGGGSYGVGGGGGGLAGDQGDPFGDPAAGLGGTQTAGGAGGPSAGTAPIGGTSGSALQGGLGGKVGTAAGASSQSGGGGGGGYFGGGGGGVQGANINDAGGGGGSGYLNSGVSFGSFLQGTNSSGLFPPLFNNSIVMQPYYIDGVGHAGEEGCGQIASVGLPESRGGDGLVAIEWFANPPELCIWKLSDGRYAGDEDDSKNPLLENVDYYWPNEAAMLADTIVC